MTKKKNLIFLTKQYPFGNGEQYVTPELLYLSREYENIYLYPSDYFGQGTESALKLPENVFVIPLNQNLPNDISKMSVTISFVKASLYEFFRTHSKRWFIKNLKRSFNVFITQYAQGIALERFVHREGLDNKSTNYYSYWFSASALCLSIMKEGKAISHFYSKAHSVDLYHERWGILNDRVQVPFFKNYKLRLVDKVFPISEHGGDFLRNSNKQLSVVVTYLGVDDFGPNPDTSPSEVFTIVTCSGLSANKRVHALGKALSSLNRNVQWIHFGNGPMEKELLDSVQSKNVNLDYRGWTSNIDVRGFYTSHHIDLFVNLSIVEGLPVSIMEILSHGIPALATSVYGTPEAVIEGVSGKLIPVDFTNEQLVDAIRWFMDNPDEAAKLRKSARRVFEEKFNAQKNHTQFAKYLSSLP